MEEGEKSPDRKLAIVFKIDNGKIESKGMWENCTQSEIGIAIAHLEMNKKALIETLEKMSGKSGTATFGKD